MNESIKIVSDGSPFGTKVFDSNGREIKGISAIEWRIEAGKSAMVALMFPAAEINVVGELSDKQGSAA